MYERLYQHSGMLISEKETICPLCHEELDENLMSPNPCVYDTTSFVRYGGMWWFINVWNCRAVLCATENMRGYLRYRKIICDEKTKEKINELVIKSVEEHGALNISGLYGLSDELVEFLENNEDKITIQ